jgi:hypothetical protein
MRRPIVPNSRAPIVGRQPDAGGAPLDDAAHGKFRRFGLPVQEYGRDDGDG